MAVSPALMIEAHDLRRAFKARVAVDGISFAVERGEVFGFLGPNGAGKSTTINMLTGQLLPSGGWARVAGFNCATESDEMPGLIGVVFEQQNLYERMSGRENLIFFARLFGAAPRRVDDVLELVGLKERAKDKVKVYSNGMRQRLLIARALINQPQVLFLDEPTRGLDPGAARDIRTMVADLGRSGTTVFLTTHYMEEADQLCHRVAFLNEGRIVALDTPQNLKIAHGKRRVRAVLRNGDGSAAESVSLALDDAVDAQRLSEYMSEGKILTIHSEEATLEDIFIQLAGRSLL
jgi:ABC-2 type transport system ATP-binding protein